MIVLRRIVVIAAVCCAPLGACGGSKSSSSTETTVTTAATGTKAATGSGTGSSVDIKNTTFTPGSVAVPVGSAVTWTFSDTVPHHVVADDGSFDSGEKQSGTFVHTFTKAGAVAYHCSLHPFMKGTVTVS